MTVADTHRAVLAVWRTEQQRLVAILARMLRDVPLAEELAQEALVLALETWPTSGVPDNPRAWLITAGKRRALDHIRRDQMLARKHKVLAHELETEQDAMSDLEAQLDDDIGDDILRLIFTASHPLLSREARTALTLRMVGGLTTEEIARAFLANESAIQQRIVRAKRTLSDSGLEYETPRGEELRARLPAVLEVIYLVFNEGYAATRGEDLMRPQLCDEALRLGRILAGLMPEEPEVHGLLGLMELHASRTAARIDTAGDPVLLLDQNRTRWDRLLIRRGLAALERVEQLGGADGFYALQAAIVGCHASRTAARIDAAGDPVLLLDQNRTRWDRLLIRRGLAALKRVEQLGGADGFYALQAAIVGCHARAAVAADTDWAAIAALYARLAAIAPSPVVELNRAIAVGMAEGPQAGLDLVDRVSQEAALRSYHLLPSIRGDFLLKLGRAAEARTEFLRAADIATNDRERAFLKRRADEALG